MEGGYEGDQNWLDGWCEGGLGQQKNNSSSVRQCVKDWKALVHM